MRKRFRLIVFLLSTLVVLAAIAGTVFLVHSYLELQAQIRYEEALARQQVVADILEDFEVRSPWLLPVIDPPSDATPAVIDFTFMGQEHSIQAQANPRIYYGAKKADRMQLWDDLWFQDGTFNMDRLNELYYNALAFEPQMDHAIESVLVQLREIRDERNLSNDEYIELIVKYVQSIPYCYVHGTTDPVRPVGCPRTPIQTLVDGTGDCDETGMLMAVLLHREGFPVSLLLFEEEWHVAVGLRIEGEGFRETGYAFIEPTIFAYISDVPTGFGPDGDIDLESMPIVLSMGEEIENPMPYFSEEALAEIARIIDVRDRAEAAANRLRHHIERTPMSLAEFNRQRARHDACFVVLNRFQGVEPCPRGSINTNFMDRREAIEWINRNAWWE